MSLFPFRHAGARELVTLDVRFTLTDHDNRPQTAAPVRLVFGTAPGWQRAGCGESFLTDARGEHRFTTTAEIETRSRKLPTNFVDSLFRRAQPTNYLHLATELEWAGHRRLYVIEIHRFANGTVLREGFAIYTPDAQGNFTYRAEHKDLSWKMADLNGALASETGYTVTSVLLDHDENIAAARRWTLALAFKHSPAPVMH